MAKAEKSALYDMGGNIAAQLAANPAMGLDALRQLLEGLQSLSAEPTDVTYEEVDADGIHAIWARPAGAAKDRVIVYTHGGGFVTNSASSHRKVAAHLAKQAGVLALVIDYRLAPENPFPAQIDDAVKVHQWLRNQGFKPEATVNAGDSAGGNLALSSTLKMRELKMPLPAAIVAFSPWLDMESKGKTFETNAESDVFIKRETAVMMAGLYVGAASPTNPLANPLHADLKGLPPVFVAVGDAEVLEDDARSIVEKARAAGVDATLELGPGQQHVYPFMAGKSPAADTTLANAGKWIRRQLKLG